MLVLAQTPRIEDLAIGSVDQRGHWRFGSPHPARDLLRPLHSLQEWGVADHLSRCRFPSIANTRLLPPRIQSLLLLFEAEMSEPSSPPGESLFRSRVGPLARG